MRTRRLFASIFAGAVAITVIGWGCNKQQTAKGTDAAATQASATFEGTGGGQVAVVNFRKVLHDTGWETKLNANMQTAKDSLMKEFEAATARYQQQFNDFKKMIKDPEKLTIEQKQQVMQVQAGMQQMVTQLQQKANERLAGYQQEWLRRYKDALGLIVRQAAQQHKVGVVFALSDAIAFVDPSVDLTDAVVDGANKVPPVITEVPIPALEAGAGLQITTQPTTAPTTQASSSSATTKP